MRKTSIVTSLVVAVIVAAVIGGYGYYQTHPRRARQTNVPVMTLVNPAALAKLPVKNASSADFSHLGNGILPPTNSWLSGMILQKTPLAVYPMPLGFLALANGFSFGLPTIASTATAITGEQVPAVQAVIGQATSFKLTRYDKISATLTYYDAKSQPLATITLAEGSPYVFFQAIAATTLTVSGVTPATGNNQTAQYYRYSLNGHDYVISAQPGAGITRQGSTLSVQASRGSTVAMYALSGATANDTLRKYAANSLRSVSYAYGQTKNTATTTFTYNTVNNRPTVMAPMAYQHVNAANGGVATYDSIYGPMKAIEGNSYTITAPAVAASDTLDLSRLSADQKNQLIQSLKTDVASTVIDKTDSYFAGKQLARAANLLAIAEQLGQTAASDQLKTILTQAFSQRLGTNYFYYDSGLKGIAATNMAFGSQDFNDHHFHYGYFLYAASVLGSYDKSFLRTYADQVNLLAADIASYQSSAYFPIERTYDPYAGHSWAAGLSPFSDGNNQESSSEAINAWNGVALWGKLTGNTVLRQSGEWMLAFESATASAAWRNVDTRSTGLGSYTSPLVDINFGGKRVYATFFSDQPSAKLGIQLIPLNPMMISFASDASGIATQVQAAIPDGNYNVPLGDYDLMYLALNNPQQALRLVGKQQNAFIDDGNSRTYLEAWIFAAAAKAPPN